jgi:CrcB protein
MTQVADRQLDRRRLRFELRELLLVAAGGVPGALLRWQAAVQLGPWLGGSAGADLLVNVLGSFLLGFLAGPIPRRTSLLLWLGIGFCGCLTTFSSWMLDVVHLIEDPEPLGPWGAKGVGEPALVATAPAILNAIHHATGVRATHLPVTPDRLRAALLEAAR